MLKADAFNYVVCKKIYCFSFSVNKMTVVAEFKYKNGAVTASIELPISESISELSHHIIEEENLQPYEEDGKGKKPTRLKYFITDTCCCG
jgi:hypothetical protein